MMRALFGFLLALGLVWAALAVWYRIPPLGAIDPGDES